MSRAAGSRESAGSGLFRVGARSAAALRTPRPRLALVEAGSSETACQLCGAHGSFRNLSRVNSAVQQTGSPAEVVDKISSLPSYVLVTPARNEAVLLEDTIRSVVAQTILPVQWVIVSDGSTDGTDEIVSGYATLHPWIRLLRMPERPNRQFAAKAHCFNAA